MRIKPDWHSTGLPDTLLVRDNLLETEQFGQFTRCARASYLHGDGWFTQVKADNKAGTPPG
jgi:hypothetical protein